ncbi:MAG: heterodisulfide reductase-related iron-sulfur binding cluster [Ilumatobacteraceae bacterium]|nr:heterodisulfide reductase-related iron-sulfur binding cluster [Ilumatobacteraceae bacterium]
MNLHLDDKELATCVSCGLCLPHCPTFRVTGEEALSPRGRIAAMRAVQWEGAAVTPSFVEFMETCVQCRGCEPACPSGVPYGHLQEQTRHALADAGRITPRWQRAAFAVLPRHRLLLAGSSLLAVAQRLRLVPRRLGLPRLTLRRPPAVRPTGNDVWLFTGCVMDAWQRQTHQATARILGRLGVTYSLPGSGGGCCGALHTHAGLTPQASKLAERVMASMPGDAPILVNSAGCGAAMKEYGRLLGTPEAEAFSSRVQDVHEYLAPRAGELAVIRPAGRVVVQDPCHLRHVQKAHLAVRTVLGAVAEVAELDDDGLCCGAGGAYSAMEPVLAGQIRERKLAAITRAGGGVVASANPGCAMHLAAAGVTVRHPIDIVAEALEGSA